MEGVSHNCENQYTPEFGQKHRPFGRCQVLDKPAIVTVSKASFKTSLFSPFFSYLTAFSLVLQNCAPSLCLCGWHNPQQKPEDNDMVHE